jgi:hypothetical protein
MKWRKFGIETWIRGVPKMKRRAFLKGVCSVAVTPLLGQRLFAGAAPAVGWFHTCDLGLKKPKVGGS